MSLRRSVKHGIGRLTASADGFNTRLTQVAHKAPTRLVPLGKSSVDKAGAAICALSNYGGGMLQGDSCELTVGVNPNARLGITTQGASRIYTQRTPNECKAEMKATVQENGLLVLAPDPCALFESSSFSQTQSFEIHPDSSVVLIDWFSSGRYRNGEHWAFDKLSTRTSLQWLGETTPFLQDSIKMDLRNMRPEEEDPLGVSQFHAFASLLLYGKQAESVQKRCQTLQDVLVAKHTRIRERDDNDGINGNDDFENLGLAGRVCMGMSKVPLENNSMENNKDAYVVRLAATTNEDIYRIFHHCLHPLNDLFGLEFYKERIRAKASEIPSVRQDYQVSVRVHSNDKERSNTSSQQQDKLSGEDFPVANNNGGSSAFWSAYMLADSAMPTGSFAHSAGLEAAAQLGIVQEEADVQTFVQAATRSSMQVVTPFLLAGHRLVASTATSTGSDAVALERKWKQLDKETQAVLGTNAPACAASLDQGKSLARVMHQWMGEKNSSDRLSSSSSLVLDCFEHGSHMGPTLGAVTAMLGLTEIEACRLLGYCVARDMVSAAVRLSLVGPLASVGLLHEVQGASEDGWKAGWMDQDESNPLTAAAACAPVFEAVHPCHEILQTRLFRT